MKIAVLSVLVFSLCTYFTYSQTGDSYNLALWKKFETPQGAMKKVSPKDGGKGFEKIARKLGFTTYEVKSNELKYFGDKRAKVGGNINLVATFFPETFIPEGEGSSATEITSIKGFVYETLLSRHPVSGNFIPNLATHWKISNDKMKYTFRLDPNARFSDGKPVTAMDVYSSWKLMTDHSLLEPVTSHLFSQYEVVVVSPYIVDVYLKDQNARSMYYFTLALIIQADHEIGGLTGTEYMEKFRKVMPVGSGEYILLQKDIVEGEKYALTRRHDYWAKDYPQSLYAGNFDKVTYKFLNNSLKDFKDGEIDVFKYTTLTTSDWVSDETTEEVMRGEIERYRVFTNGAIGTSGYAFNMRQQPFDDIRVRKAFAFLFPRKKIIAELLFNEYEPYYTLYPSTVYANPKNSVREFNVQKAEELLREAGWSQKNEKGILVKDGKELVVDMDIMEWSQQYVEPYVEELKKVGIVMNLKLEEWHKTIRKVDEREFSIFYFAFGGLVLPNPETSVHSSLAYRNNNNNIQGVANHQIDILCENYNKEFDRHKQIEIIRKIDWICDSLCLNIFNWNPRGIRIATWSKFGIPEFVLSSETSLLYACDDIAKIWWYDNEKADIVLTNKGKKVTSQKGNLTKEIRFWKELKDD